MKQMCTVEVIEVLYITYTVYRYHTSMVLLAGWTGPMFIAFISMR